MTVRPFALVLVILLAGQLTVAQQIKALRDPPDEWFTSPEGQRILENILSWQNPDGGWPKQYNYEHARDGADKLDWEGVSTIDNYGTYTELRLMARASRVTEQQKYRDAFARGIAMLLKNQYPNGGWPQRFPPGKDYSRDITFNDSAMARVVMLMRDIAEADPDFEWVDPEIRAACKTAYARAIDCIINSQIRQNGKPVGWCSQHDPDTLEPAWGRTYEPPSINSSEGAEITLLLMEIPSPDARVRAAIQGAVEWFERSKISGKKMQMTTDQQGNRTDRVLIDDSSAPPIWARFYDIQSNAPIFMDRNGTRYASMDKLPVERRIGYAWYSNNGNKVLEEYPKWKQRVESR